MGTLLVLQEDVQHWLHHSFDLDPIHPPLWVVLQAVPLWAYEAVDAQCSSLSGGIMQSALFEDGRTDPAHVELRSPTHHDEHHESPDAAEEVLVGVEVDSGQLVCIGSGRR